MNPLIVDIDNIQPPMDVHISILVDEDKDKDGGNTPNQSSVIEEDGDSTQNKSSTTFYIYLENKYPRKYRQL